MTDMPATAARLQTVRTALALQGWDATFDVMDMWVDEGTLVIISHIVLPASVVAILSRTAWHGPVEAYRAADMVPGVELALAA